MFESQLDPQAEFFLKVWLALKKFSVNVSRNSAEKIRLAEI